MYIYVLMMEPLRILGSVLKRLIVPKFDILDDVIVTYKDGDLLVIYYIKEDIMLPTTRLEILQETKLMRNMVGLEKLNFTIRFSLVDFKPSTYYM